MTVIVIGRLIKTAVIKDQELLEGEPVRDPESFVSRLKETRLKADIFTFAQNLPDTAPRHNYHLEWDNLAVIPITSFADWWTQRRANGVRQAVKKAQRLGVVVKLAEFNDTFVEGIRSIYNESPVRQGRPFWHYRKDFDTVKRENSTYLERSAFIGAYYNDDLIGFIRMVYIGKIASIIQIIGQRKHYDKTPTNALIAKAVEICEQKGVSHLVHGSYMYSGQSTSLTEFKWRNGFQQVLVPRYFIPLTLKGRIGLKFKLHHGIKEMLPRNLVKVLVNGRSRFFEGIVAPLRSATAVMGNGPVRTPRTQASDPEPR